MHYGTIGRVHVHTYTAKYPSRGPTGNSSTAWTRYGDVLLHHAGCLSGILITYQKQTLPTLLRRGLYEPHLYSAYYYYYYYDYDYYCIDSIEKRMTLHTPDARHALLAQQKGRRSCGWCTRLVYPVTALPEPQHKPKGSAESPWDSEIGTRLGAAS